MTKAVNIPLLKDKALSDATIGGILDWMGEVLRVDITEDGRRIAYPPTRTEEARAA